MLPSCRDLFNFYILSFVHRTKSSSSLPFHPHVFIPPVAPSAILRSRILTAFYWHTGIMSALSTMYCVQYAVYYSPFLPICSLRLHILRPIPHCNAMTAGILFRTTPMPPMPIVPVLRPDQYCMLESFQSLSMPSIPLLLFSGCGLIHLCLLPFLDNNFIFKPSTTISHRQNKREILSASGLASLDTLLTSYTSLPCIYISPPG